MTIGRIEHHARRGKALVEGGRINEGLEARARLAPGLGDAVEFALKVIEAADQGDDRAVFRIDRDQRALRLRHLHELQRLGAVCPRCRSHRRGSRSPRPASASGRSFSSGSSRRAQDIFSQGSVTAPRSFT